MCGIVLTQTKNKKATRDAYIKYKAQEKRGTEGYGCLIANNNSIFNLYRATDENQIRVIRKAKASFALLHHRKPTSTPNLRECTHPIFVSNDILEYDYYVVHNGVISNCDELKTTFEGMGFNYTTEIENVYRIGGKIINSYCSVEYNDSESLAIDLAIAIEDKLEKTTAKGSIAFVVLQLKKGTGDILKIYYGRNALNPLKVSYNSGLLNLSSEGVGMADVLPHTMWVYDTTTNQTVDYPFEIGVKPAVYTPPPTTYVYPTKYKDVTPYSEDRKIPLVDIAHCATQKLDSFGEWVRFPYSVVKSKLQFTNIPYGEVYKMTYDQMMEYSKLKNKIKYKIDELKIAKVKGYQGSVSKLENEVKEIALELKTFSYNVIEFKMPTTLALPFNKEIKIS